MEALRYVFLACFWCLQDFTIFININFKFSEKKKKKEAFCWILVLQDSEGGDVSCDGEVKLKRNEIRKLDINRHT